MLFGRKGSLARAVLVIGAYAPVHFVSNGLASLLGILLRYASDASPEALRHADDFVRQVGRAALSIRLKARIITDVGALRGQVSVCEAVQAGLRKGAGGLQAVGHGLGQILGVEVCFHCLHVVFNWLEIDICHEDKSARPRLGRL